MTIEELLSKPMMVSQVTLAGHTQDLVTAKHHLLFPIRQENSKYLIKFWGLSIFDQDTINRRILGTLKIWSNFG